MKKRLVIYCDMDGVLADFNAEPDGVERFRVEADFFTNLKPIKNNVEALRELIADGKEVNILSASPNERADQDKIKWLSRYIPELRADHIIIMRNGENKAHYIKADGNAENVLFDDYGFNCECFRADGHRAYKIDSWHSIRRAVKVIF